MDVWVIVGFGVGLGSGVFVGAGVLVRVGWAVSVWVMVDFIPVSPGLHPYDNSTKRKKAHILFFMIVLPCYAPKFVVV
jgi:hypothetical protein